MHFNIWLYTNLWRITGSIKNTIWLSHENISLIWDLIIKFTNHLIAECHYSHLQSNHRKLCTNSHTFPTIWKGSELPSLSVAGHAVSKMCSFQCSLWNEKNFFESVNKKSVAKPTTILPVKISLTLYI